jgi:MoxR-like ATPase
MKNTGKTVDIEELKTLTHRHYDTKVPLFVRGGFGIGKSAVIKSTASQIATQKKKNFVVWNNLTEKEKLAVEADPAIYFVFFDERLSQYEPSDIRGLPQFLDGGETINWSIPRYLALLTHPDSDGILFFDEINLAAPSIQSQAYQLLHDRNIVDKSLNDNVFIMCAGNRAQDKCGVFEMSLALRDRMSEVELAVQDEVWFEWASKNEIDGRIIAFLKYQPSKLNQVVEKKDMKSTTPRGWERTHKLITGLETSQIRNLVSVAVGDHIATEMIAFLEIANTVDLDGIIKKPKEIMDINRDRMDLLFSVCSALSERFAKDVKIGDKLFEVADHLMEVSPEFSILLIRLMKQTNQTEFRKTMAKSKAASRRTAEWAELLGV